MLTEKLFVSRTKIVDIQCITPSVGEIISGDHLRCEIVKNPNHNINLASGVVCRGALIQTEEKSIFLPLKYKVAFREGKWYLTSGQFVARSKILKIEPLFENNLVVFKIYWIPEQSDIFLFEPAISHTDVYYVNEIIEGRTRVECYNQEIKITPEVYLKLLSYLNQKRMELVNSFWEDWIFYRDNSWSKTSSVKHVSKHIIRIEIESIDDTFLFIEYDFKRITVVY